MRLRSIWSEHECSVLFGGAAVFRGALVIYSVYHDANSAVKYTDIDYKVFTDAALQITEVERRAQGPLVQYLSLPIGDPYTRETYRYTPMLALLMLPNLWLHPAFGKALFCVADLGIGYLLLQMLMRKSMPRRRALMWVGALWLLNPWVAAISTRGSSEALLGLLVIASLERADTRANMTSAFLLGLATHFKLYPIIYGAAMIPRLRAPFDILRYTLAGGASLILTSGIMYAFWGWPFIDEALLYHARRLDFRHNFSPYFYPIYLSSLSRVSAGWRHPLVTFVPQCGLSLSLGALYGGQHLPFAWFAQTVAFVTFNKVCTSQYFLWFIWFLPVVLPFLRFQTFDEAVLPLTWAFFITDIKALWLGFAYRLEFLGQPVFRHLWFASIAFFLSNIWTLIRFLEIVNGSVDKFKLD